MFRLALSGLWKKRLHHVVARTCRLQRSSWKPTVELLEDRLAPAGGILVAGAAVGDLPMVKVLDQQTGAVQFSFMAYDQSFRGGVSTATGDVNGDGVTDIITGAGVGGGPHVKVFNGKDMSLLTSFFA